MRLQTTKQRQRRRAAKGRKRAALSAQQSIPYTVMHPDGVCRLPGGLYTKTVEYEDINYSVASTLPDFGTKCPEDTGAGKEVKQCLM